MALGLSAIQFDERAASIILPTGVLNSIYSGQMWTGSIFSVVPAPVASTLLFTSNISVALLAFAGGLSFGLITSWILFQNGFMLGVVFKLCADYGLLGALLEFIAGHGALEISAIIVSGGAGFVWRMRCSIPAPIRGRCAGGAGPFRGADGRRLAFPRWSPPAASRRLSRLPFSCLVQSRAGNHVGVDFWLYLLVVGRSRK